jgi:DNA-binding transcriptional ArsR family regulator
MDRIEKIRYTHDMNTTSTHNEIVALLAANQPLFQALGDMARQEIIVILAGEDRLTVGELARRTHLSRPAVSHHLKILKDAGLLHEVREGVRRYYQPSFAGAIASMESLVAKISKVKDLL